MLNTVSKWPGWLAGTVWRPIHCTAAAGPTVPSQPRHQPHQPSRSPQRLSPQLSYLAAVVARPAQRAQHGPGPAQQWAMTPPPPARPWPPHDTGAVVWSAAPPGTLLYCDQCAVWPGCQMEHGIIHVSDVWQGSKLRVHTQEDCIWSFWKTSTGPVKKINLWW